MIKITRTSVEAVDYVSTDYYVSSVDYNLLLGSQELRVQLLESLGKDVIVIDAMGDGVDAQTFEKLDDSIKLPPAKRERREMGYHHKL